MEPSAPILNYSPPRSHGVCLRSLDHLLAWQILSILGIAVGGFFGIAGSIVAVNCAGDEWNTHSTVDIVCFILWLLDAALFTFIPPIWTAGCVHCRKRLRSGDFTATFTARKFCRLAQFATAFITASVLFAFSKALYFHRFSEIKWWLAGIAFLLFYAAATEVSRRAFHHDFAQGWR